MKYQLFFFPLLTVRKLGKYISLITASFLCGLLNLSSLRHEIDDSYIVCVALLDMERDMFNLKISTFWASST